MADPRFFQRQGPFRLAELAAIGQVELNDPSFADLLVEDVSALETAGVGQLSFLDNKVYIDAFAASRASVCIVAKRYAVRAPCGMALLHSDQPYRAFALMAQAFYPRPRPLAGVSPAAMVDAAATLGRDCQVEAGAVRPVSLLSETGALVSPADFLDLLAPAYARFEAQFTTYGFAPIRAAWLARAARLGELITARLPAEEVAGRFDTVDEQGQLVLSTPQGLRHIAAADVFF